MAWLGIARYRRAEDGFVIAREALRYAQEGWWDKAPTARPVSLALANFFLPFFVNEVRYCGIEENGP